jgi:hypothetical protein
LISVDAPRDNLRPDRPSIDTLEIFANQATLVIESQRKLSHLKKQLDAIKQELDASQKGDESVLVKDASQKTVMSQKTAESAGRAAWAGKG